MRRIDLDLPLLWLILPLALVLAPHALALPLWISVSWLVFAVLSLHSAKRTRSWPAWLKMLFSLAGIAGVLLQFGTIIGPQGGVALLVFLSGPKCWKPIPRVTGSGCCSSAVSCWLPIS
jgi:protein-glutamine gamma-glutamyltransferase